MAITPLQRGGKKEEKRYGTRPAVDRHKPRRSVVEKGMMEVLELGWVVRQRHVIFTLMHLPLTERPLEPITKNDIGPFCKLNIFSAPINVLIKMPKSVHDWQGLLRMVWYTS